MSPPDPNIPLIPLAHNARDRERGLPAGMGLQLFILTLRTSSIGEPPNTTQSPPNHDQILKGDISSESLFSMYIDRVKEVDNKMVDSWKGDADGILLFVSFQTTISDTQLTFCIQLTNYRLASSLLRPRLC